jgi:LPXTG-motif cell wall-anchored protein
MQHLLLPHWLILAGSALALLGVIGLLFRRKEADEVPLRELPQQNSNQADG